MKKIAEMHFAFWLLLATGLLWPGGFVATAIAQEDAGAGSQSSGNPDEVLRHAYEISRTAQSEDQLTQVIQMCQQALDGEPGPKSEEYGNKLMAWTLNKRGETRAASGQEQVALEDFDRAVELAPASWQYLHNRGVSRAMLGQKEEALADFNRTIELQPTFAKAYFNRGEMLYDLGQLEEAIGDYTEVIRLNPRDAMAYTSRGHTYYRLQNTRAAFDDFARAIRLDPSNAEAYTLRGDAYGDQGRFTQAANDYRTAIRVDPNYGRAYHSAAWLMATCPDARYRNAQLALDSARKAIELDGREDYRYLATLAAALANAGEYEQAARQQEEVVEMAPQEYAERHRQRLELYQRQEPYRDVLPE